MRYGDLTYREIRERAAAGWLAVAPTGCTEQQGPHLPVDFDTWFAERITLAAAQQAAEAHGVFSLVLPAIPFGPTPEHRNYGSGYVDIPVEVHDSLVSAVLDSLAEQGFGRVLVWRGCGGHDLGGVVRRFNQTWADKATAILPAQPYHEIWCRIGNPDVPGGHADSFTTSIALRLRPGAVRLEELVDPQSRAVNWDDPELDFTRYSSTGVIGDPTFASAGLGEQLWIACVQAVTDILVAAARGE